MSASAAYREDMLRSAPAASIMDLSVSCASPQWLNVIDLPPVFRTLLEFRVRLKVQLSLLLAHSCSPRSFKVLQEHTWESWGRRGESVVETKGPGAEYPGGELELPAGGSILASSKLQAYG